MRARALTQHREKDGSRRGPNVGGQHGRRGPEGERGAQNEGDVEEGRDARDGMQYYKI